MDELKREWSRLLASKNPKQRGFEFEAFIESLLRGEHFNVERKVGLANRRQVDLFASRGQLQLLFEAKWRGQRAGIGDVHGLNARLSTAAPSVVGVLVSKNGFTSSVMKHVAETSNRPVLLVSGKEIEALLWGVTTATALFQRKLNHLTRHRQVLLDEVDATDLIAALEVSPPTSLHMMLPDGTPIDYWEGSGDFDPVVFTINQADVDWVVGGGHGVTFDVELGAYDQDRLLKIFELMDHLGWTTSSGTWSINQLNLSWAGLGAGSFTKQLMGWSARYGGRDMHHTEQVIYADRCDNGFYSITADVFAHESRGVRNARISFQLEGIPIDLAPFQSLVESLGDVPPPFFRPRNVRAVATLFAQRPPASFEPLALVVEHQEGPTGVSEDWVVGVVLPDPGEGISYGDRMDAGLRPDPMGYWVCRLKSWHPVTTAHSYQYVAVRVADSSDAVAVEALVDWADSAPSLEGDEAPLGYWD